MTDTILIGEVTNVHGIRGELKIRPLTDDPGRFYELEGVYLKRKGRMEHFRIESVRFHKDAVLLSLDHLNDRSVAESYKGAEVWIDRADAVDLSEDEYFISDLTGLIVIDRQKGEIGRIKDILTTSGTVDTVEIKTPDKMIYVPFRKIYFDQVDLNAGTIQSGIPEEFFSL